MPKLKITKTEAERVPFTENGQIIYFDTELKGFGLLVSRHSKSYIAQKDVRGKSLRINIGRHGTWTAEEARKEARLLLVTMDRGEDPKALREAKEEKRVTFAEAYQTHLELLRRNESSEATIKSYDLCMRLYFNGWKKRELHTITRSEVRELHTSLGSKNGPYAANRAMKSFRAIFNTALKEYEYLPPCPTIAVQWFKEHRRQEPIPAENLPAWFQAVNKMRNPMRRDYQLYSDSSGNCSDVS